MSDLAPLIGDVARRLLGEPNKRMSTRHQLRFGSRGALTVEIGGTKSGTWFDHSEGVGGGVLGLVVRVLGGTRAAAWRWLQSERLVDNGFLPAGGKKAPMPSAPKAKPAANTRDRALAIWRQTRPAPATLTDGWLTARRIRFAIPSTIRHHDGIEYRDGGKVIGCWPAMITRLDDPGGEFCSIARLWLDDTIDPNPVRKAPVPFPRKTLGPLGVAWFGPRDAEAIVAGEGIETVLAGREHTCRVGLPPWGCCREPDGGTHDLPEPPPEPYGCTAVACICAAGLTKFDPPATVRRLFICEDDDDAGRKATLACADRAAARGITVTILREAR